MMQPLTPKRLDRAHSIFGWTLSITALLIGVAMWRHSTGIIPPPPIGVMISSMVWILFGMIGIFYNARTSGLLTTQQPKPQDATDSSLDLASQRLSELQSQLDQNLITLDEYRQERREIIESVRVVSTPSDCE